MKALQFNYSIPRYLATRALAHRFPWVVTSPLAPTQLRDIPEPELLGPKWVKIRPIVAGICGSDMSIFTCHQSLTLAPFASYPFVVGHEVCGEIIETGSDVKGFEVGERVGVCGVLGCVARDIQPPCRMCQRGLSMLCENFTRGALQPGMFAGSSADASGFMAEVGLAHESQLLHVPDGVSSEDVSMLDPFACALHMVLLNEIDDDETVLVYGCGVMGLCTVAALRVTGFKGRIIGVEPSPFHADTAKQVGADEVIDPGAGKDHVYTVVAERTGAKLHQPILSRPLLIGGVERVFDTVGTSSSVDTSLRVLANRGTFNLLGIGEPKGMDWTPIWLKELTIHGIYGYGTESYEGRSIHTFALTLELLAQGKLDLGQFITHRFSLDQWRQALQVCLHKAAHRAIKVAFVSPQ